MQQEIEAKYLNVKPDEIRKRLQKLGANCEHPMRLMRRVLFDYPDSRFQKNGYKQRLRIRDEGDKIAVNYKRKNDTKYADELEIVISSFEDMAKLFEAIGLVQYSFQETKRETWRYKDVEVVIDEWPWLDTYIEIEGPDEQSIQGVAEQLGFNWNDAKFGSVDTAYKYQYPGMKESDSISDISEVRFEMPVPDYFKTRMKS